MPITKTESKTKCCCGAILKSLELKYIRKSSLLLFIQNLANHKGAFKGQLATIATAENFTFYYSNLAMKTSVDHN